MGFTRSLARMSYNGATVAATCLAGALTTGAEHEGRRAVSDERHEQSDAVSTEGSDTTVAGMVAGMRAGRVSRRRLVAALTGLD